MDRFKSMESFVAVAKCGGYSRAAKQLGVSRALMSRRVIELEARLGVRLFNRNTHRLSLTDAGANFLTSCQDVLSELETAERSLVENRKVARGNLRLLASQTFGTVLLGAATAEFMIRHPEIEIFVATTFLRHQAMELVGNGFDLALRTTELADSTLVARKIAPIDWFVVAAPAYLAVHGTPSDPRDLSGHKCLVTGIEPVHHWRLESTAGTESVKITGISIGNLTTITRDAAVAGLGVAILPDYCVAQDLATGRLCRLLPRHTAKRGWIYAVYPKERNLPVKTRLFMDFLIERFQGCRWGRLTAPPQESPMETIRNARRRRDSETMTRQA